MKYEIKQDYIRVGTKRRSGQKIGKIGFIVAHDTGNSSSTARNNVDYYKRTADEMSASAHTFIDHKEIIECVPLTEKAWHVRYEKTEDNKRFGDDANDIAIGVELCYDANNTKVDNLEAYKRYVWYIAELCYRFGLNPLMHVVGHSALDPGRKTDPENAFKYIKKSFGDFLLDVNKELVLIRNADVPKTPTPPKPATPAPTKKPEPVKATEAKVCSGCLSKKDADDIIDLLRVLWGNEETTVAEKKEIGRLADEIRRVSGQKPQNK